MIRRVLAVTLGLVAAGVVFGAVAGVVALAIIEVLRGEFGHFRDPRVFLIAATLGAIFGAVCAPLAGWLLLRHVPLGRAFAGLTIGAVIGGVIDWFLPPLTHNADEILYAAAIGSLCAAVVLRVRPARFGTGPRP
jgi:hypothetical protein